MDKRLVLDSGISLPYKVVGREGKTPIVLVHGFTGHGDGYDDLIEYLEDDFHILTFDQRGNNDADKPIGETYEETRRMYTMEHFAADVKEVVDKLGFPKPFVLFGHSMGGMVSQVFVLSYPDYVSHLVLGSTLATYYTENMVEFVEKYKTGEMPLTEEGHRLTAALGYTVRWARQHKDRIEEGIQRKLKVPDWIYIGMMENFVLHYDVRPRLKEVEQPTLVITGRRDAVIRWTYSQELHELIPDSTLVVIPRQNHNTINEVPEVVAAEVKKLVGL
ncbi:MAG: alpha/beta fold hydrolase [Promethearchaeota archaeon]